MPGCAPATPAVHVPSVLVHAAVRVELGGLLAEVPHVAVRVLAVPVGGALLEVPVEIQEVTDRNAAGAVDRSRCMRDDHDVAGALPVLDAGVDVPRPRVATGTTGCRRGR